MALGFGTQATEGIRLPLSYLSFSCLPQKASEFFSTDRHGPRLRDPRRPRVRRGPVHRARPHDALLHNPPHPRCCPSQHHLDSSLPDPTPTGTRPPARENGGAISPLSSSEHVRACVVCAAGRVPAVAGGHRAARVVLRADSGVARPGQLVSG